MEWKAVQQDSREIKWIISLWKLKGHMLWVKLFFWFSLNKRDKLVSLMHNYGMAVESAAPNRKQAGKRKLMLASCHGWGFLSFSDVLLQFPVWLELQAAPLRFPGRLRDKTGCREEKKNVAGGLEACFCGERPRDRMKARHTSADEMQNERLLESRAVINNLVIGYMRMENRWEDKMDGKTSLLDHHKLSRKLKATTWCMHSLGTPRTTDLTKPSIIQRSAHGGNNGRILKQGHDVNRFAPSYSTFVACVCVFCLLSVMILSSCTWERIKLNDWALQVQSYSF